jgi:hypothetical protein
MRWKLSNRNPIPKNQLLNLISDKNMHMIRQLIRINPNQRRANMIQFMRLLTIHVNFRNREDGPGDAESAHYSESSIAFVNDRI